MSRALVLGLALSAVLFANSAANEADQIRVHVPDAPVSQPSSPASGSQLPAPGGQSSTTPSPPEGDDSNP